VLVDGDHLLDRCVRIVVVSQWTVLGPYTGAPNDPHAHLTHIWASARVSPEIAVFIAEFASVSSDGGVPLVVPLLGGQPNTSTKVSASSQERVTGMKVWIDQDLCTGDGLCEEIAPDVFTLLDDGLAYVKEGDKVFSDPGGAEGLANVPAGQEEATIEAAEECPGECIFIEVE
jgi:ferredoxin